MRNNVNVVDIVDRFPAQASRGVGDGSLREHLVRTDGPGGRHGLPWRNGHREGPLEHVSFRPGLGLRGRQADAEAALRRRMTKWMK